MYDLDRFSCSNKDEFTMCFDMGCPRFVNPDESATSSSERSDYVLDAQRHQGSVFRSELDQHWIDLPRLRSYLKLYTTLPVSKLNQFLREVPISRRLEFTLLPHLASSSSSSELFVIIYIT